MQVILRTVKSVENLLFALYNLISKPKVSGQLFLHYIRLHLFHNGQQLIMLTPFIEDFWLYFQLVN